MLRSWKRLSARRGFVLFATALSAVAILGMMGLCTDLARLYVAKNELQNYADAAAIAATNRLDGTTGGIGNATTEATTNVNKWFFDTASVGTVTVDFATNPAGSFVSNPNPASGYAFTRVQAQGTLPLYFMTIFSNVGSTYNISATSVAGQTLLNSLGDGAFPFSPDSHVPNPIASDPTGNFGFLKGELYTLRWEPVGKGQKGSITNMSGKSVVGCTGDMNTPGFIPGADNNGERGYIDLLEGGGGGGASFIRDAIVGSVQIPTPLLIGQAIDNANGNKQTEVTALAERVAQDTNPTTATYYTAKAASLGETPPRTYYAVDPPGLPPPSPPQGNGRRIVTVPVNNPTNDVIMGFALFFLPTDPCPIVNGKQPCCAEYIGSAQSLPANGGGGNGGGSLGLYRIKLFQ